MTRAQTVDAFVICAANAVSAWERGDLAGAIHDLQILQESIDPTTRTSSLPEERFALEVHLHP